MAFIKKLIGPDEQTIGITTIHWIYGAKGLLWLASLMIFATAVDFAINWGLAHFEDNPAFVGIHLISAYIFWVCAGLGIILFLLYFLLMVTTEIGLTSKRIIFKRGWIFVSVKEVDLEEIKAANVDNGLLGRFLNYGYIAVDARFVENLVLPALPDPYRFIKAMNEARSLLKQNGGTMNVVLDGDQKPGEINIKQGKSSKKKKRPVKEKAKIEAPPEPPAHALEEERYAAIEETPQQAVREVMQEAKQNLRQAVAPAAPSVQPEAAAPAPLVFERDPKQRKEELRRRFKSVFTRRSNRKAP